jgi:hypothetical protein
MHSSAITRCICSRGSRIQWSQVGKLPHQAAIPKILNQTGCSENSTSSKLRGSAPSWTWFVTPFHICKWKCLIPSVVFIIPKIVSWGTGSRSGDILRSGPFKSCLDPFFEESPNLKREIWYPHCSICYTQNSHLGTRSRSGDILQLGPFKLHLDPFLEEIPNLKREIQYPHYSIHYTQNSQQVRWHLTPSDWDRSSWSQPPFLEEIPNSAEGNSISYL